MSQPASVTIKAKILTARRYNNNFAVLRCQQGNAPVSAVGVLPLEGVLDGTVVSLTGRWDTHPTFGRQFRFDHLKVEGSELFFFLTRIVRGVGEKLARRLIEHYGEDTLLHILEHEPQTLTEFKGIKQGKLAKISASWKKYRPLKELSDALTPYGVTPGMVTRIFNHLGEDALSIIRGNPYNLTRVPGVGFKKADEVALNLGIEAHSEFRIDACIEYVLSNMADGEGNTLCSPEKILEAALKELNGPASNGSRNVTPSEVQNRLEALENQEKLYRLDNQLCHARYYNTEGEILHSIAKRASLDPTPLISGEALEEFIHTMERELQIPGFSDEQRQAIELVAQGHRTLVITGYAGTGKSTISRALLRLLAKAYGEEGICCMALSGIAADRIRKTSGFPSATIHTTLAWKGDRFEHDKDNPLPYRVVLLDESSMVNSSLFRRILDAVPQDAILILLGDPAQLPPIGAGDVFADLVEANLLPMAQLTKIYRQSDDSVLVYFANQVRQGLVPEGYQRSGYLDFEFMNVPLPGGYFRFPDKEKEAARQSNTQAILSALEAKVRAVSKLPVDNPVTDFQILSPMRKGPLGTAALNLLAQSILNPGDCEGRAVEAAGVVFKKGDKVVHTSNKDMPTKRTHDWEYDGGFTGEEDTRRIFNGSVGIILDADPDEGEVVVGYPGSIAVLYETQQLGDILEHAYALSVHKAQGSEYQRVILPVSSLHSIMLNAKWLYTALTRAKTKIVVIGQDNTFARTCKSLVKTRRRTVIQGLLKEALAL
ncbi:SF1B family DNA helicase RecD2 [Geoalkalibacter halelectricus]|uniref:SF1B family DNA helicase RecD2 n=1 Tax=Geoalkalibacter halelectricus TaxID=2847045 RepID=UPI002670A37A|nr:AAA family ATPase [Geoalkalibacter halelectricus]MDO3380431.1 AAA family ATPase [Geoalkalibacter halelectricus]